MCIQSAFPAPHLGLRSFALCVQNQGPDFRLLVSLVEELGPSAGPLSSRKGCGLRDGTATLSAGRACPLPTKPEALWTQQLPRGARKPLFLVCGESLLLERHGNDAHDRFK